MGAIELSTKFIFDDEILINDDRQSINGYLWAVDYLVDKLPSSQEMENINFYAVYDVKANEIKVASSYYTFEGDKECQKWVDVELTDKEKVELVDVLQSYCKTRHNVSCVEFVNEFRAVKGFERIEVNDQDSLLKKIKAANSIKGFQKERPIEDKQPER